jgi:LPS sulfotransferase NodH
MMHEIEPTRIDTVRNYIEAAYGALPKPRMCYLVLMSPRCGSTLLCKHLQVIHFGKPIEAFHFNQNRIRREHGWDIDFTNPFEYIRKALDFQTVDGIFGMKLSWVEFEIFLKLARQLTDPAGVSLNDAEVVEVFFPDALYIHLKRCNKVEQAISYAKGMQDGIWVVSRDQDDNYRRYLVPALYDHEHIESCLDNLLAYDFAWDNYLKKYGLEHMVIWYENLADNYTQVMTRVYQYLGIGETEIPDPPLRKLSNKQSSEWYERFLNETPWLKQRMIAEALEKADFATAFIQRSMMIAFQKEQFRWHHMPANRYKSLRSFLFRARRKMRSLAGQKKSA